MKSNLFFNSFIDGMLYFFCIKNNPFENYYHTLKTDFENIQNDWINVGKDIQKAYEQEISHYKSAKE